APVVGRGLGVVEDGGDLLQVLGAVEERDVAERLAGEQGEPFGGDLEDLVALEGRGGDVLGGELAVFGVVGPERERVLGGEIGHAGGSQGVRDQGPGDAPPGRRRARSSRASQSSRTTAAETCPERSASMNRRSIAASWKMRATDARRSLLSASG